MVAHWRSVGGGVKRAVAGAFVVGEASVTVCVWAFSRQRQPPRWEQCPLGPFPSVGA